MRQADPSIFRPGQRLPTGLFTRQGVKLLSAGSLLTEEMCRVITQSKWGDLFLASDAPDLHAGSLLRIAEPALEGTVAAADLVTAGGVVAVGAGETVEPHHADAYEFGAFLGAPGIEETRLRAARLKIADQYAADLAEEVWSRLPLRIEPSPLRPAEGDAPPAPLTDEVDRAIVSLRRDRARRYRRIFARILGGLPVSVGEVAGLVSELVEMQRADPARFVRLAMIEPDPGDYLPDHCYGVACLCVAVAARLGWSDAHARLAGMAGLLADVGMGLVPRTLRMSERPLDEFEINRVRRHPTFSVLLLEAVDGLPEEVRMAAHQHHERENGSGYPRALRAPRICDLARVAGVADAFAAAAARRRYRAVKKPYDAVEEIIMLASSGVFDRAAARALVETVGLFPVGSFVMLSNDAPAAVVGVRPEAIDRPVVRLLQRTSSGSRLGITVHLTDFGRNELWVRRPIDAPAEHALGAA